MTEIKTNSTSIGQIQIADEVIAIIAGTAAMEIDGVVSTSGNFTVDFSDILGKKNLAKGVKVLVNENEVTVEINIMVKFGYKIQDVSTEVQNRVKTAIETMTGLAAAEINVNVTGVAFDKDKSKESNEPQSI